MKWYLRKADTDEIFPQRDWGELLRWANEALINPLDMLSQDGEKWVAAHSIPEFEMVWSTTLLDGTAYGPTNASTLREFCSAKLLGGEALAVHAETQETLPVSVLLSEGSVTTGRVGGVKAATPPPAPASAPAPASPAPKEEAKKTQVLQAPMSLAGLLGKGGGAPGQGAILPPKQVTDYRTQPLPGPPAAPPPPPDGALKPSLELALATDPEIIALEEEVERAKAVYLGLKEKFDALVRSRTSG
jgi:hypothetical protein